MADTFIYDGPTQQVTESSTSFTVRDGQYLFMTGFDSSNGQNTFVTYSGPGSGYKVTFVINTYWAPDINRDSKYSMGSGGGYFQHISRFNWDKWGTKWKHAASGGCMYTIRKACKLVDSNGTIQKSLNAGDIVIIGERGVQGQTGNVNSIRMWGYRTGGLSGTETETNGLYIQSGYLNYPENYTVNTF